MVRKREPVAEFFGYASGCGVVTAAARVVYDDEQLEWAPLEQAMRASRQEDRDVMVGDFMWMGAVDLVDGGRLHLYEHTDTRRYLRLDADRDLRTLSRMPLHDRPVAPRPVEILPTTGDRRRRR